MSTTIPAPVVDARPVTAEPGSSGRCPLGVAALSQEMASAALILALITVAVAETIVGSAVATNMPPPKNLGSDRAGPMSFTDHDADTAS